MAQRMTSWSVASQCRVVCPYETDATRMRLVDMFLLPCWSVYIHHGSLLHCRMDWVNTFGRTIESFAAGAVTVVGQSSAIVVCQPILSKQRIICVRTCSPGMCSRMFNWGRVERTIVITGSARTGDTGPVELHRDIIGSLPTGLMLDPEQLAMVTTGMCLRSISTAAAIICPKRVSRVPTWPPAKGLCRLPRLDIYCVALGFVAGAGKFAIKSCRATNDSLDAILQARMGTSSIALHMSWADQQFSITAGTAEGSARTVSTSAPKSSRAAFLHQSSGGDAWSNTDNIYVVIVEVCESSLTAIDLAASA